MKTSFAMMALGLVAAVPAYAEVIQNTGGVTVPNAGGVTTGTGRGIIMNSDQRGITTGNGSAVTGSGRTGVRGLHGGGRDVIRMNPSVSLDGTTGTNAVNKVHGGVSSTNQ